MQIRLFMLFFLPLLIIVGGNAEADCNGDQPINGQDWVIVQHTHCWNEDLSINDIEVNSGSFKLENVTLNITGKVTINAKTDWIESNITHYSTTNANKIDVRDVLIIKGTRLTMNAPEHVYGGSDIQGIQLSPNSRLVITDIDDDPETTDDVSNISSLNWNVSDPYNTALEFWEWPMNSGTTTVELTNSVFQHVFAVATSGDNVIVKNNSFYYCGTMAFAKGDNLTFENNYAYNNSYGTNYGAWFVDFYGNNGTIRNNFIEEGDGGAIFIDSGYNYLIENNTFLNVTSNNIEDFGQFSGWNVRNARWINNNLTNVDGYGFWINNGTNSTVAFNSFKNVSEGLIAGGENLTINNNIFDKCGWTYYAGAVGGCIAVGGGSIPVDIANITIFDNHMSNVEEAGIMLYTGAKTLNYLLVYDNYVEGGYYGVLLTTYGSFAQRSENLTIDNNTFYNNNIGIGIYKSYTAKGGTNYLINNNYIYNSSSGIYLDGTPNTYPGIVVTNNIVEANNTGIFLGDIVSPSVINNTVDSSQGIECLETKQISVIENKISAHSKGIVTSDCTGEIRINEIVGTCNRDDCDKVFFTKVAKIGAEFVDRSVLLFTNNNLSLFDVHIKVVNSDIDVNDNSLDYGNTGISFEDSNNLTISSNLIYNNSVSIYLLNSQNMIFVMNNLSNFEKGIYSINSSLNILTNYYEQGIVCLDFLDSNYEVSNYNNFDCSSAYLIEKYNIIVNILTDDGIPSSNHQFYYFNDFDNTKIYSSTYGNGFSDYIVIRTLKVDNSGLNINFNNYSFGYYHNEILNIIELDIDKNQTITAYLDIIPPSTLLYCDSSLINSTNITLTLNIVSGSEDFYNYDIYYLINDGENFAEWELFGTFNETVVFFNGQDSTKYRFKSISRDIYGNIEIKTTYDYEINIDTTIPDSYFENLDSDYYFSGQNNIILSWNSNHKDITQYTIEIFYTNFTNAFLNPSTVIWTLNSTYQYEKEDTMTYSMNQIGHYGFKIQSQDQAGNVEIKEEYDFIINYDPSSDSITLIDLPARWGNENLTINYVITDINLKFDVFIALEAINNPTHSLAWYSYTHNSEENTISLTGLQDSMRYYIVIQSFDLAGNIENPLNTTEIFSSNGTFNQVLNLEYIPLMKLENTFIVEIDEDLDGIYETKLQRGDNLSRLGTNEYYLDSGSKRIYFGGITNGGYTPSDGINNIQVSYSGAHGIFEVFTAKPDIAKDLTISSTNISNIIVSFTIDKDVKICKFQRATNPSKGWFNEMVITPCEAGAHEYFENNLDLDKTYYYRIWTEDEFGHSSISDENSIIMEEVVKLYETNEKTRTNQFGMDGILPIMLAVGIILLFVGGILLYQSKNQIIDDNIQLIESKPIAKYKIEQLYLIYQDGRLLEYIGTGETQTDTDIMSGMLTAINDFVQDSFQSKGDLGAIDYGDNKVVLQRGKNCYLAAVVYGEVDKYLRSKLANIVRTFEGQNNKLNTWNGDEEQIIGAKQSLEPLIQETIAATREMVDNYLSEKEIIVNTVVERKADIISLLINISNYSSEVIENCSLSPVFNSSLLTISKIKPDLSYSFSENAFFMGDLGSFNEIQFTLELIVKTGNPTDMELDLIHTHKGREAKSNNKVSLI